MKQRAWLEKVTISDPNIQENKDNEDNLTKDLFIYLEDARFFSKIRKFPGDVKPGDLILHFDFNKYYNKRIIHPAYIPGALITLTLYIWFGGPVTIDTVDYSATLTIKDSHGSVISQSSSQMHEDYNVSLYSAKDSESSKARASIVNELLTKALVKIKQETNLK